MISYSKIQFCRNEHLTWPSRHAQHEGDLERLHISFVSGSPNKEAKGHLDEWKKVMDGWMDDEQTLRYTFSLMLVLSISVGQSYMFLVRKKNLMIGNENDLKYFLH